MFSIFLAFSFFTIFSIFLPLGLSIAQWNKIPRDISTLRWLLIASLLADMVGLILGLNKINNLWVGDIFMFIQFSILLYIFSFQFERKNPLKVAYASIVLFYLITLIFFNGTAVSTLVGSNAIDGLILIVVSIFFFYKLLNELKVFRIQRLPILWIAFGTLFYYSGNLFVFLTIGYIETEVFLWTWLLHNFLNLIKNMLFAVALWQSYKTLKQTNG